MSRTVLNPAIHKFIDSELDKLARLYGTDKHSGGHGFTLHYENYLSHFRNKPISLLEMGVHTGASIKMWEDYFPHGYIFGIDNLNQWQERVFSERVDLTVLDLNNDILVEDFFAKHNNSFDVIIDDAAHTATQQKKIFEVGFKALKSGGIYVIEDLHTAYWESFEGGYGNKNSMMNYLKELADCPSHVSFKVNDENGEYQYCETAAGNGPVSYLDKNVYSVHFYGSICFVMKTPE